MSRRTEKPFWDPDEVKARFNTKVLGKRLIVFNRITSTNDFLKRLARRGAEAGALVLADEQTAGRGRLGRSWQSPPKSGLWFSMLMRPELPLEQVGALSLAIAAAVAETLSSLCQAAFAVKWPNDILVHQRKVCGILCEAPVSSQIGEANSFSSLDYVVAGIGINVNQQPHDFNAEWRQRATSLAIVAGHPLDRQNILIALVQRLDEFLFGNLHTAMPLLLSRWRSRCAELGKSVVLRFGQTNSAGIFEDIGAGGELILRLADGQHRTYAAGEVSLVQK
jgi:BirA family biotin operon repressor/biotin-[acetyl-CoA-carboxylase] ligase